MKKLIILLAVLFMFMSVSVLTFAKEEETMAQGYEVRNSNHTQKLGGKSKNASKGLARAAERSKSVVKSKSGPK